MAAQPPKPPAKNGETEAKTRSLEKEIERQIGDLIPVGSRAEVVARVTNVVTNEYFSGPIAHPRHLREYEDICPGSAERIIAMAEQRNQHNMAMENRVIEAEIGDQRLGMWLGASLFAALILAAFVCALMQLPTALVASFLGAAVIGGVGLFVKGRNGQS